MGIRHYQTINLVQQRKKAQMSVFRIFWQRLWIFIKCSWTASGFFYDSRSFFVWIFLRIILPPTVTSEKFVKLYECGCVCVWVCVSQAVCLSSGTGSKWMRAMFQPRYGPIPAVETLRPYGEISTGVWELQPITLILRATRPNTLACERCPARATQLKLKLPS